jgi:hypothetical protein
MLGYPFRPPTASEERSKGVGLGPESLPRLEPGAFQSEAILKIAVVRAVSAMSHIKARLRLSRAGVNSGYPRLVFREPLGELPRRW